MKIMADTTPISISKRFQSWLKSKGRKGENYEEILKSLLRPDILKELEEYGGGLPIAKDTKGEQDVKKETSIEREPDNKGETDTEKKTNTDKEPGDKGEPDIIDTMFEGKLT